MLRFAVAFLSFTAAAFAQSSSSSGALECRIVDSHGAAIPAAKVEIQQKATGSSRKAVVDAQGNFRFAGLPVGEYSLRIEQEGFNPVSIEAVQVSLGQTVVQRVAMTLAAVTEKLEVHEQADSLQTTANTANVALGGERIEEAPAANRNFLNFVLTAPGVATSPRANTGRSSAGMRNVGNDSGFVFLGMRGRNNSISIDGVDNRDETTGGNRVAVGLEMLQEFRVSGTSVSTEFGGAAGGLVNMVTHTGQNLWHGDFTFFHQNERMNGRNPEDDTETKARFRRYQPGVSVGGPIRRDRTFFFTAFEHSTESTQDFSAAPEFLPVLLRGLYDTGEADTTYALKTTHKMVTGGTLSARYAFSRGRVDKDVQSVDNFTDLSARGSSRIIDHSLVGGYASSITPTVLRIFRRISA
ncbi:MAG: carboxypeptidase regulatory-like domain-containing protein [Acidobacteria bacterium]|nr:carboxypeptidase regulatory-like domain-containing protein [Acidobacteriota bacterium]